MHLWKITGSGNDPNAQTGKAAVAYANKGRLHALVYRTPGRLSLQGSKQRQPLSALSLVTQTGVASHLRPLLACDNSLSDLDAVA